MGSFQESNQTNAEKRLALALRKKKYTFSQNHQIGGYEVDFWFADYGLVVEVDGFTHLSDIQRQLDNRKDRALIDMGLVVLRITNIQIWENINKCLAEIEQIMDNLKSLKNGTSINNQWKLSLEKLQIPQEKPQKTPRSIEEYFLSLDDTSK